MTDTRALAEPKWFVRAKERVAKAGNAILVGSDLHLLEMAIADRATLSTENAELERQLATEREWTREFDAALAEHWLTGIECNHAERTDVATCYCAHWRSLPQPNIPSAVREWIDHVKQAAVVRASRLPASEKKDIRPSDTGKE